MSAEDAASRHLLPAICLASVNPHQCVLSNATAETRIQKAFDRLQQAPIKTAAGLLKLMIQQRKYLDDVEAHLDLGILQAAIASQQAVDPDTSGTRSEQYQESLASFRKALDYQKSRSDAGNLGTHYHFGRVLVEAGGDLTLAVSQLRQAVELKPNDARARFYLGKAIQALVEQDLLAEASEQFKAYLDAGAPLGERDAILQFLESRRPASEPDR